MQGCSSLFIILVCILRLLAIGKKRDDRSVVLSPTFLSLLAFLQSISPLSIKGEKNANVPSMLVVASSMLVMCMYCSHIVIYDMESLGRIKHYYILLGRMSVRLKIVQCMHIMCVCVEKEQK